MKVMRKKALKIALIMCIVALFVVSLLPMFSPVMSIVRQVVGSAMIGWWSGTGIVKIWYK